MLNGKFCVVSIREPGFKLNFKYLYHKKRGNTVITYEPFWNTLKQSEESTYTLIYNHNLSSSTIDRLRKNKPLSTTTINDLCRILNCDIDDIITYRRSETDQAL